MSARVATCLLAALAMAAGFLAAPSRADDPSAEHVFELDIRGGKLAGAARIVRVKQGDSVRLRWTTDAPMVVHVHGYNIEQTVEPGAAADMAFTARATGRFTLYAHAPGAAAGSHQHGPPLVTLEVFPR